MFEPPPNATDFYAFLLAQFPGATSTTLPSTLASLAIALDVAVALCNTELACISGQLYCIAVYNLATDRLVNYGQDAANSSLLKSARARFGIGSYVPGVPDSASDNGTAVGLVTPETLKNLTLGDLQKMKTPWGREYVGMMQDFSPAWGLT